MAEFTRIESKGDDCRETYSRSWGIVYNHLRGWNEAMRLWLAQTVTDRPEEPLEIDVLYQTPERAFADIVHPPVNSQTKIPVISFIMTGSEFDRSRWMAPPLGSSIVWDRTRSGDKWLLSPRPIPYDLVYSVTVWAKFQVDLDTVAYQFLSRFTPDSYLLYNQKIPGRLQLVNHLDSSQLEPGEKNDRWLRHDYTFKVDAWLPLPYREVGSISQIIGVLTSNINSDTTAIVDGITSTDQVIIVEGDFTTVEAEIIVVEP